MASIIVVHGNGTVTFRGKTYRAALGRAGVSYDKREGDGTTPADTLSIRQVLYRADRVAPPHSPFPTAAITQTDGWCDDPSCPDYNQPVILPHAGSFENLWRADEVYNIIVVLGWNDTPPVPGRGSAIFMHLARPAYPPTDGCVALSEPDLREILEGCTSDTLLSVER